MYFDRKAIKEAAKVALKRSHWMVVVAVLIVTLLGGTIAGGMTGGSSINLNSSSGSTTSWSDLMGDLNQTPDGDVEIEDGNPWMPDDGDVFEDYPWMDEGYTDDYAAPFSLDDLWNTITETIGNVFPIVAGILIVVVLVAVLFALFYSIFVGNVMTVGGHGWLLRYWRGETPGVGEVFASFRIYKPTVVTMLVKNLYVFLWSLLFIIPGIVKSYAYSMVPYIIYENPNLTADQAITISRKMTDGYKGDLFVFYLSYIGWHILSSLTAGIVGVLYVNPYMGVAHAGIYEDLKQKAIQNGRLTWADFGQTPPVFEESWVPPVYDPSIPTYTPSQESYNPPQW